MTTIDAEDIASALDIALHCVTEIVTAFQGRVLDGNRMTGWEKRQPAREDNSAERVKKWRERNVTQRNAPDKDKEEDKDKKKTSTTPKASPSSFALPLWISEQTWRDFEEMRRKVRAPMTDRARQGIVADLSKLRAIGQEPEQVLVQSITHSWKGVFALRTSTNGTNGGIQHGRGDANMAALNQCLAEDQARLDADGDSSRSETRPFNFKALLSAPGARTH